jgi:hypothetical protein
MEMDYLSRDELGREIIALAKEEIEKFGDIPGQEVLNPVFESKFGEKIKVMGLFDLAVLMRRNEVIRDTAQAKNIQNIVRLTEAFAQYLETKKAEKEQKTKDFLTKKMTQMAA